MSLSDLVKHRGIPTEEFVALGHRLAKVYGSLFPDGTPQQVKMKAQSEMRKILQEVPSKVEFFDRIHRLLQKLENMPPQPPGALAAINDTQSVAWFEANRSKVVRLLEKQSHPPALSQSFAVLNGMSSEALSQNTTMIQEFKAAVKQATDAALQRIAPPVVKIEEKTISDEEIIRGCDVNLESLHTVIGNHLRTSEDKEYSAIRGKL